MFAPICPTCGATLRVVGRGATLRKHGVRWLCPVAEREFRILPLPPGTVTVHQTIRTWWPWELEE